MSEPLKQLRRQFLTDLANDRAQAAREQFCQVVSRAFGESGAIIDLAGYVLSDDNARALGLVARIGGELGGGAVTSLRSDNAYAAAALTRQVVEVEYLLWTFADDIADAAAWFQADRGERQARFSPAAMRKRSNGRFRSREYQVHCERGGHPDPNGCILLDGPLESQQPFDSARAMWVDLGHHLERAWGLFVEASAAAGYVGDFVPSRAVAETERRHWHDHDPLAQRLAIPPSVGR